MMNCSSRSKKLKRRYISLFFCVCPTMFSGTHSFDRYYGQFVKTAALEMPLEEQRACFARVQHAGIRALQVKHPAQFLQLRDSCEQRNGMWCISSHADKAAVAVVLKAGAYEEFSTQRWYRKKRFVRRVKRMIRSVEQKVQRIVVRHSGK